MADAAIRFLNSKGMRNDGVGRWIYKNRTFSGAVGLTAFLGVGKMP